MKKAILLLILSFSLVGNTSITKLGVGGPGKSNVEPSEIYSDPLKELDTEKVDELIKREMSVEEAFRELADIKTVDMVKTGYLACCGGYNLRLWLACYGQA
jgi:hypothetical protein